MSESGITYRGSGQTDPAGWGLVVEWQNYGPDSFVTHARGDSKEDAFVFECYENEALLEEHDGEMRALLSRIEGRRFPDMESLRDYLHSLGLNRDDF